MSDLPRNYYICPSDLYRFGTETSATLNLVRPIDVKIREVNGVKFVVANNKGISLLTLEGLKRVNRDGWVWKINPHRLPPGLKLYQDKPDHMMICPIVDMPLDEYKALLGKMLVHCERVYEWIRA